jgi:hypothetical protein
MRLDTSHPYELIIAQIQTLFMLLGEEIRHNHVGSCWLKASSGMNQVESCWLTTSSGLLRLAQPQLMLLTHCSRYTPA